MMRINREPRSSPPPPPPAPGSGRGPQSAEQLRRSWRLEERRRTSLGAFLNLPLEVVQHMLSYMPARSLSKLAQVSSGWQQFLRDWIQLRSSAWFIAPLRRYPYLSDEFYDEYTELGLLCRRLLRAGTLSERAHACWKVLEAVERACIERGVWAPDPSPDADPAGSTFQYEPTF
ncbi:F-box only protein 40, partial [Frankliniella fusca]